MLRSTMPLIAQIGALANLVIEEAEEAKVLIPERLSFVVSPDIPCDCNRVPRSVTSHERLSPPCVRILCVSSAVPSVLLANIASTWRPQGLPQCGLHGGFLGRPANVKENDVGDPPSAFARHNCPRVSWPD